MQCVGGDVITSSVTACHITNKSLPTTIRENWKPLLTAFLNTWLGRLAKPTNEAADFS